MKSGADNKRNAFCAASLHAPDKKRKTARNDMTGAIIQTDTTAPPVQTRRCFRRLPEAGKCGLVNDHYLSFFQSSFNGFLMNRSFFYLYAVIVTLMPALMLIPVLGQNSAFSLLTGDAYLYLGIAQNSSLGMFSFDGEAATNGFHPLWQFIVWLLAQVTGDPVVLMNLVAWLAVALTLAGVLMIGTAIGRATGSWLLAGLVTPGLYFLVVGQGLGNLAVWDFFSGMEAGLSLAITGVLSLQVVRARHEPQGWRHWLLMGVTLGFLVLARLDEVFAVLAITLAWVFWYPKRFLVRVPSAILLVLPSAVFLCLYWAYNWATIGLLMPISGAAKGEGALIGNGWITLATFFGPLLDLRAGVTDYTAAHEVVRGAGFRVTELIFPAVFAAVFILLIRRHFRDQSWAPLVAGMCGAILLKAAYGFVAVNYWDQAPWYYAFAIGTLSLTAALLLAPVLARLRDVAPSAVPWLALIICLVSFLQASQAYLEHASGRHSGPRVMFWDDRGDVDAALAAVRPDGKLIEFGDGMLNFALDLPVRHGFVFAGDIDSLEALRSRTLLRASYEDGYTVMSSYEYLNWPGASLAKTSDDIRAFLHSSTLDDRVKAELDRFEFEIVYIYEPLSIPFIAFRPLPAT